MYEHGDLAFGVGLVFCSFILEFNMFLMMGEFVQSYSSQTARLFVQFNKFA